MSTQFRFAALLPLALLLAGCDPPRRTPAGAPAPAPRKPPVHVVMETSKGAISLELYEDKAPETVRNFLAYVQKKHYDGTIFHRVIPGFMIQGGGFTPDLTEKPTDAPIPNEAKNGLKNQRGALAMARLPDANSARAQFFINLKDKPNLDPGGYDAYGQTVFGKVTDGMDVVDEIAAAPTETRGAYENVPVQPVVIQSVTVKE